MIYFIQRPEGGPIKIGTSGTVSHRVKDLEAQYKTRFDVLAVMEGDRTIEASLHLRFSRLRIKDEWFNPGPELTCFIGEHGKEWNADDPALNGTGRKIAFAMSVCKEVIDRLKAIEQETGAKPSAVAERILLAWFRTHSLAEIPLLPEQEA